MVSDANCAGSPVCQTPPSTTDHWQNMSCGLSDPSVHTFALEVLESGASSGQYGLSCGWTHKAWSAPVSCLSRGSKVSGPFERGLLAKLFTDFVSRVPSRCWPVFDQLHQAGPLFRLHEVCGMAGGSAHFCSEEQCSIPRSDQDTGQLPDSSLQTFVNMCRAFCDSSAEVRAMECCAHVSYSCL